MYVCMNLCMYVCFAKYVCDMGNKSNLYLFLYYSSNILSRNNTEIIHSCAQCTHARIYTHMHDACVHVFYKLKLTQAFTNASVFEFAQIHTY